MWSKWLMFQGVVQSLVGRDLCQHELCHAAQKKPQQASACMWLKTQPVKHFHKPQNMYSPHSEAFVSLSSEG